MDRFRKPSLIALGMLLLLSVSATSLFAYGRLPGRGIESGGDENPEISQVGEPDWGAGGGRAGRWVELDVHVRVAFLHAIRVTGFNALAEMVVRIEAARSTSDQWGARR